jgi:hypothetical protein
MARLRGGARYEHTLEMDLWLSLGPHDLCEPPTREQLQVAWEIERDNMMDHCRRNPNKGWRPWAWWEFDAGEPKPEHEAQEALRLYELGELSADDVEAVKRRAIETIEYADQADELEAIGSAVTSPADAVESMRENRHQRAREWQRLLDAIQL